MMEGAAGCPEMQLDVCVRCCLCVTRSIPVLPRLQKNRDCGTIRVVRVGRSRLIDFVIASPKYNPSPTSPKHNCTPCFGGRGRKQGEEKSSERDGTRATIT